MGKINRFDIVKALSLKFIPTVWVIKHYVPYSNVQLTIMFIYFTLEKKHF